MSKLCKKCGSSFEPKYKTQVFCCPDCNTAFYRVSKNSHPNRKYKKKTKDEVLREKYGISLEVYQALSESQNHRCKICKKDIKNIVKHVLFVDHCHKSHRIRGLLCGKCNSMLGFADDNPEILISAAKYLEDN